MSTAGVSGLLVISMIALAAPVLAAGVQRARVPEVVIEIVAGIVVGPSVLGWVKIDQPVGLVALLGLAFLLFLAGLEVDLKVITPSRLRAPLAGYAASLLLGSAAGLAFHAAGWVRSPLFLAITLSSSSLGLVVPVLADARQARTLLGQLIIAGATLGEFGAITLLSLFFSATRAGPASNAITFGIFGVAAAAVGLTLSRTDRSLRLDAFLTRLQDTTAEIRVRIAVALLVGFVVLAAKIGLQIILGAFLAGVILNIVDRDTASHPLFRTKLDALGYGFLVPVFFVSSGVEFDLTALTDSPSALAKIPLFLLALLAMRGAPAAFYVRTVGRRGAVAAGLLQATSLPVIVTAASIGVAIHAIPAVTASALVAAGLLSVLLFPAAALAVVGAGRPEPDEPPVTTPETDHPQPTSGSTSLICSRAPGTSAKTELPRFSPTNAHLGEPAVVMGTLPGTVLREVPRRVTWLRNAAAAMARLHAIALTRVPTEIPTWPRLLDRWTAEGPPPALGSAAADVIAELRRRSKAAMW